MTEPDSEDPSKLFDDHPPARSDQRTPRRRWLGTVLGLLLAIPIVLTLAGALTSPPHVQSVPVGHLVYLEADEPSDHTAMLRGLRLMGPDGSSRQILHEFEPQDVDAGSREWITQPRVSPNGMFLAFEKQLITLQEEQQSIDNQLWVVPLTGPNPQPQMLLDLTARHLKQFVGLAWSSNSKDVLFLNDSTLYTVDATGGPTRYIKKLLPGCPALSAARDVSATHDPFIDPRGTLTYSAATPTGQQVIMDGHDTGSSTNISLSLNGRQIASQSADGHLVTLNIDGVSHAFNVRWGWAVFGKRHITALRWSPEGKYLAYSVSKPPFEDELFYLDPTTGKCFQLPVRAGRAGWDWGP